MENKPNQEESILGDLNAEDDILISVNSDSKKSNNETNKVYDVNIDSLENILDLIIKNGYDFATVEPSNDDVKVIFKKNKVEKDVKHIKYPTYSNIVIKTKSSTKLKLDEQKIEQEGESEIKIENKDYKLISKVVPSVFGEKLFIKLEEIEKKLASKKKEKIGFGKMMLFLGATAFVTLIVGGAFMTFIVLNANTPEDVDFFRNLNIPLGDINKFIASTVTLIFSILIFVESIFLIIYLFKFYLTKKEFKKDKIKYGILATVFLIITFGTATGWMAIDKQISKLPDWQNEARGEIQMYDNSKLKSENPLFNSKDSAIITEFQAKDLIGPITIKYDLGIFEKKRLKDVKEIKEYIWDFGDGNEITTLSPDYIYEFNNKGLYKVKVSVKEVNRDGEINIVDIKNFPAVNIKNMIYIKQEDIGNGGKKVTLDATELEKLGDIEWYRGENMNEPVWEKPIYNISSIFKETLIGFNIKIKGEKNDYIEKIIIIGTSSESNINGKLEYEKDLTNDKKYTFWIEDADTDDGTIEDFNWTIGDKTITNKGDVLDLKKSSEITYEFKNYGKQEITVEMIDSGGKSKKLNLNIEIQKKVILKEGLKITDKKTGREIKNVNYDEKYNQYFIKDLNIPTDISFNAKRISSGNPVYKIKDVIWDIGDDKDIDGRGKTFDININTQKDYKIGIEYIFEHTRIPGKTITLKELVIIEGVEKDIKLDLDITKNSNYAPALVTFDASKSKIKGENIIKFVWDYGDNKKYTGDSKTIHRYSKAGEYEIVLKAITESGKEFETTKKLVLNPKPLSAKISASLKKAPTYQEIDFSSSKSEGQIISYFWDFGDGITSIDANPSHSYKKSGNYKVKLTLEFSNGNIKEDSEDIEVYDE